MSVVTIKKFNSKTVISFLFQKIVKKTVCKVMNDNRNYQ